MRRSDSVRKMICASLTLLLLALLSLRLPSMDVVADPRRIVVPDDYSSIQSAVDNANVGDTIFVRNGTYLENVVISKALTLIGESNSSTIVDGGGSGSVFTISANGVKVSDFMIQRSGVGYPSSGIRLFESTWWCAFKDNLLVNNFIGILLSSSYGNVLERNTITGSQYSVYLLNAGANSILDNAIIGNYAGFAVFSTSSCNIIGNTIYNNTVGISLSACSGNDIYYNNFARNEVQNKFYSDIYSNKWDNGYPSGGNYWSNYYGRDLYKGQYQNITGSDGIGDSPYLIAQNNTDRFPFMEPVAVFHDVAVLAVVPSASRAFQGQTLGINVTVANVGNYTETFNLSVYYVKGSNETLIGTKSLTSLAVNAGATVSFDWSTLEVLPGNYTLKASVSPLEGEENLANNILEDGTVAVTLRFHDVAVLAVVPSVQRVYQGQTLNISVTVANLGDYIETFNVTAYYDESIIDEKAVLNLEAGAQSTLVLSWNTTSVEPGIEYSIRVEAGAVVGESNLDNNAFVDGSVKVRSFALEAIKIAEVIPTDNLGNPSSNFNRGAIAYFKVTVNNTSVDPEIVLVTVNAYDSSSASLGVVSFKGLIMPGISVFILGLPIPSTAHTGTGRIYANTFTDWPFAGGLPYAPEKSSTFQVLG
jgi:nitrous oxidase accessory protein